MEMYTVAMANRSVRTIKAELEFLADNDLITSAQLSTILNQLPTETATGRGSRTASPAPAAPMNNMNSNGHGRQNGIANEKNGFYGDSTSSLAPPAYPMAPAPPVAPALAYATALFAYTASDAGDLALQANDRIAVTEYMNAEWWKGQNERTKQEGIFPRNYVKIEEKITEPPAPTNYGNMPLDVSNGAGSGEPGKAGKGQEMGKKFGKKLGNAAVFGAGATIGSNIVNSIF